MNQDQDAPDMEETPLQPVWPQEASAESYRSRPYTHVGCPADEYGTTWVGPGYYCPGCGKKAPSAPACDICHGVDGVHTDWCPENPPGAGTSEPVLTQQNLLAALACIERTTNYGGRDDDKTRCTGCGAALEVPYGPDPEEDHDSNCPWLIVDRYREFEEPVPVEEP